MAINIERDNFTVSAKQAGLPELVPNSLGWYLSPDEPWHLSKKWVSESERLPSELRGVPHVIELCQGREAEERGYGSGLFEWHGPFRQPMLRDRPGSRVCGKCREIANERFPEFKILD